MRLGSLPHSDFVWPALPSEIVPQWNFGNFVSTIPRVLAFLHIGSVNALHGKADLLDISNFDHSIYMQVQLEGRKVDEDKRGTILGIMSDRYCRAIIEATMSAPKAAIEISAECKIPISTVYRRLQILHDNKLLAISGSITQEGKKHFLYKSRVKAMTSTFNGGNLEVEIVPNLSN